MSVPWHLKPEAFQMPSSSELASSQPGETSGAKGLAFARRSSATSWAMRCRSPGMGCSVSFRCSMSSYGARVHRKRFLKAEAASAIRGKHSAYSKKQIAWP